MALLRWLARSPLLTHHLTSQPQPSSSSSFSSYAAAAAVEGANSVVVPCGLGDKKTKKGKRFKGSFGNSRPKKEKKIERIKDRVEVPRSTPWPLPFKVI